MIFIARNGNQMGGWPEEKVRGFLQAGTLFPTDHYWREGMAQWDVLANLPKPSAPAFPTVPAHVPPQKAKKDEPARSQTAIVVPILLAAIGGVLSASLSPKIPSLENGGAGWIVGSTIGSVLIFFGLAWLISLIFPRGWRLAIRCGVVLVLSLLVLLGRVGQRALLTQKVASELTTFGEQEKAAARDQIAKGQIPDNTARTDAEIAKLKSMSQDQTGDTSKATEVGAELMQDLNERAKACRAAEDAMLKLGVEPSGITSLDDLQKKRDAAVACHTPVEQIVNYMNGFKDEARAKLQAQGVAQSSIDEFMAGMSNTSKLQNVANYWQLEDSILSNIIARLDLLKGQWGKWHVNADGTTVFEDGATADAYNNLNAKIRDEVAQQKVVQQKMLGIAPTSASTPPSSPIPPSTPAATPAETPTVPPAQAPGTSQIPIVAPSPQ